MKAIIIFDSFFGNTEKIAKEIKKVLSKKHEVSIVNVKDAKSCDIKDFDTLIIGSPTRAFSPSENTVSFLKELGSLDGKKFLTFDTRADIADVPKLLGLIMKVFGYADKKIAKHLRAKGAEELSPSRGFFVNDKEGPLKDDEIERVRDWLESFLT
jgi:flavodoxin I